MMQISGLPPDLNSLLQFVFTSIILSLLLIYLFNNNNTDSKNFFLNFNLDEANCDDDGDDENEIDHLRSGDYGVIYVSGGRRSRDCCGVCGNLANSRCLRCKAFRYCSRTCQIEHWRADHRLECEEFKSNSKVASTPTSSSGKRAPGDMDISFPEHQQSNKDEALAEARRSSKKNSIKELKNVEECPICISIIRTYKSSRPSVACDTCKHKFHLPCLSKWFSTSKKSICPICRSLFKSDGKVLQHRPVKNP